MFSFLCAGLAGASFMGCSKSTNDVNVRVEPEREDDGVKQAGELFQYATEINHFRDALRLLGPALAKHPGGAELGNEKAFLRDKANLNEAELQELEAGSFRPMDAHHLESCFLFRGAARGLSIAELPQLAQAERVFHWVMRRVLLHEQVDEWLPPAQVLRRGHGGARDRALVFLEALRQLKIEGCVVAPPGPPDDPFGPLLVGVLIPEGDDGKGQVYLFDPRAGLPIAAPDNKRIATLGQVATHGELLKPAQIKSELVPKLTLYVACPLTALSPRMKFVQQLERQADEEDLHLHVDLQKLRDRLTAATGREVVVWNAPAGANGAVPPSPLRAQRLFLPPEEGGLDKTGRFKNYVGHLVPMVSVFQHYHRWKLIQYLPTQALGPFTHFNDELFVKFYREPEEFFLRCRYEDTLQRISRIAEVMSADEFAGTAEADEFQKMVADWRKMVAEAYLEAQQGTSKRSKVDSVWSDDYYLRNLLAVESDIPLNKFPKRTLSQILLAATSDALGHKVRQLEAGCAQEKAHAHLARADFLDSQVKTGSTPRGNSARDNARRAWANASRRWNDYLDKRALGQTALHKRLQEIHDARGNKQFDTMVMLWEQLHLDMHAWFDGKVRLAEAYRNLGDAKAAVQVLLSLREDIAGVRQNQIRIEIFKSDSDLAKAIPNTTLGHRMSLLARDWEARGPLHWLQAAIDRSLPKEE